MRTIEVSDEIYHQLAFAARVFGVDIADVVTRLVGDMPQSVNTPEETPARNDVRVGTEEEEVAIHAIYQGLRITGIFRRSTNEVRVTSDPLANHSFSSPSAAAVAVVGKLNPGRQFPHTNGRTFWVIDKNGKNLRSIMGRR